MQSGRYALIIAAGTYEDAALSRLLAPAHDAGELAAVLADPEIGGFQVETLLDEPSYVVAERIEAFYADRRRDDLLVLYFSCHGIKDESGRLYYAAPNTSRKRLRATAVPASLVNEVMRESRSARKVLLLDCCYSGAFARGMLAKSDRAIGTRERFRDGRGLVVLTAADELQYSFEGESVAGEGVRSVFTRNIVRGLVSGEADRDHDGNVSLDELYDYVYDRVAGEMPAQAPQKWGLGVEGEIIIARNPHPVPEVIPVPVSAAVEASPRRSHPFAIAAAIVFGMVLTFILLRFVREEDRVVPAALMHSSALTTGSPPMVAQALGFDASHHNALRWEQVDPASVSFVYLKATEGVRMVDSTFARNWSKAKERGVIRGAYHYFDPGSDPAVQATHFAATASPGPGDLPPALVVDFDHISRRETLPKDIGRRIRTCLEFIERITGRRPVLYTRRSWDRYVTEDFSLYPLWIGDYDSSKPDSLPGSWKRWTFHQYSDKAPLKGFPAVDASLFNGSREDLRRFVAGTGR